MKLLNNFGEDKYTMPLDVSNVGRISIARRNITKAKSYQSKKMKVLHGDELYKNEKVDGADKFLLRLLDKFNPYLTKHPRLYQAMLLVSEKILKLHNRI